MKTLTACLDRAIADGYVEDFAVVEGSLVSQTNREKLYSPEDVHIQNYYRFEGESNPDDMAILYDIQTSDGTKGTLVDAYGPYADASISAFLVQVEDIHKRTRL